MNRSVQIFTIGHSKHKLEHFLANLKKNEIRKLVDVRSVPSSRFSPQFNKKRLSQSLKDQGIEYVYMGDVLGGRPHDETVYRSGQLPKKWAEVSKEIDYDRVRQKEWYQQGIERLLSLANQAKTVVMCAEENPDQCHRKHLIAQSLPEDVDILHIRGDGSLEKDEIPG
jgi:uncharacterized protein (DUF488 family)